MCKFFSCVVTKDKRVYWSPTLSSHEDIIKVYGLNDTKDSDLCRIEVDVKYGKPVSTWVIHQDEQVEKNWFKVSHENSIKVVLTEIELFLKSKVLCGFNLHEADLRGANLYGADLCGAFNIPSNLKDIALIDQYTRGV